MSRKTATIYWIKHILVPKTIGCRIEAILHLSRWNKKQDPSHETVITVNNQTLSTTGPITNLLCQSWTSRQTIHEIAHTSEAGLGYLPAIPSCTGDRHHPTGFRYVARVILNGLEAHLSMCPLDTGTSLSMNSNSYFGFILLF